MNFDIIDGMVSYLYGFFEVVFGEFRNGVFFVFYIDIFIVSFVFFGVLDFGGDGFFDGKFDSVLCDEIKIGIGEVVGFGSDVVEVDIVSDRSFVELSG